jgi:pimeloyl-ACP methyl ester carboxylesterase
MKMIIKLVIPAVLVIILTGCNIQDKYLYHPSSSVPSEESLRAANLKRWQSSETEYRGLVAANEAGGTNGTIIVFHGNGGIAADRAFYVKILGDLGYRVILAEYPGYGGRKGEMGEKPFVKDACETVKLASEMYGGPLFILGESLGCGVVAATVGKTSVKIDGIVLVTPWDTLASVARSKFPYITVRLFLKDRYDSIENLSSFKGKIAVVGAGGDEIIPITHAEKLFKSLPGPGKRMWTIPGAGHNDWPMYVSALWWKEVMGFMAKGENEFSRGKMRKS